jgi:hypothetical protein
VSGAAASAALPHVLVAFLTDTGTILGVTPSLVKPLGSLETTVATPYAGHLPCTRYGSPDHDDHRPVEPAESVFRHSGWKTKRRRVIEALQRTGASGRRILNFSDCGSDLWVKADGQELVLTCNRCHDRMCDPCQNERRQAIIEQIMLRLLEAGDRARFCTFTLKHQDAPLSQQIDRLYSSFKLLRQHPTMGKYFRAGVWFFEAKLDKAGRLWHPHLHVVQVGPDRMPQAELSQAWHQITGDSFIVHVCAINDQRQQVAYVTKYTTKPLDPSVVRVPAKLDEFVVAVAGRRLFQCFGDWSKAHHQDKPTPRQLRQVGALCTIHQDALEGSIDSLVIMHQLHATWPKLRKSHPLPPELSPLPPP